MNKRYYKILIIDDEDMYRFNMVDFFEDESFIVDSAESAEEGLKLVEKNRYDGAIVDMRLPGMDGNQFILNANKIDENLKFVIHSGSSDYAIPKELRDINIKDEFFFLKPLHDMSVLTNAIRQLIEEGKK